MRERVPRTARARSWFVVLAAGLSACAPPIADRVPLDLVQRRDVPADSSERMEGLTFTTPEGDSVSAYLRRPVRAGREALGGVVLVAGRETGRRAAEVVPGPLDVAVLAVEYPEEFPEELSAQAMLGRLSEIRESALLMPGILGSAGDFLAEEPDVDPGRITLVGVSFGVPFAAAAGDDPVFRSVALHHGGGDLYLLFDRNLPVESGFLRAIASRVLAWYMGPLDPARHIGDIAPKPFLLINGTLDRQVPRESTLRLTEEAEGPVRQIWLPHGHLMPGDTAVMRELADSTLSHFDFLGPGGP